MKYIGALDLGTTSIRFIIFDKDNKIISVSQKEHSQIYPKAGYVEQNPMELLQNTKFVITDAIKRANITHSEIATIGITNQRETSVVWNKNTGKPYYNAIVWQDTRTDYICKRYVKYQNKIKEITGLPLATYFSATKLVWLFENIPSLKEDAKNNTVAFGTVDSWIIWNLNNKLHITDVTNASRTMLMNLKTLDWDDELLQLFKIPENILPQIKSSSEYYGDIFIENKPLPVSGILGDQQAALFGHRCLNVGDAKNTYGTGCFLLMNIGDKIIHSQKGLLTTVAYKIGNQKAIYALEGSVAVAGSLVKWFQNNLGLIESAKQLNDFANKVQDNGGVYIVPAFSGLFAPYWDDTARGIIAGLTHHSNKYHLSRAILEAVAYQTKDVFIAMEKDSGIKLKKLKTDGGMTKSKFLMQFQSDILNIPIYKTKISEITALGAAFAAGLAIGFWKNQSEIKEIETEKFVPKMNDKIRKTLYKNWKKAIKKSKGWIK